MSHDIGKFRPRRGPGVGRPTASTTLRPGRRHALQLSPMSHIEPASERELATQLRDLAVITAAIGDLVADLEPGAVDLRPLRVAHDEHIRAFAHAVCEARRLEHQARIGSDGR